ncbi:MAG: DUF695 domain-containing protein [Acidobacteria bacterium]|nr:DUF695 domain-containing protein [Acidobacteriota bacterium]
MGFLSNLFGKEEAVDSKEPIGSYEDFWAWFANNEKHFYNVVKSKDNVEPEVLDKIILNLARLHDGLFLLCGMYDDNTVELIITTDGNIKNIVFAEEVVDAAPKLDGWRFTALKPEADEGFYITMQGYKAGDDNLHFYSNEAWEQPDEIDIVIVHDDLNEDDAEAVRHATFIFLDNYLGELAFATTIDSLSIIGRSEAEKELRPLSELKPYLQKRHNEFVEKYDGFRKNTDEDSYSLLEAELKNGFPLIAVVNTALLTWDRKPSHPWIAVVEFTFNGNENGMPDDDTYQLLGKIEDEILAELHDADGYLNIGRETAKDVRSVYFACKEFRKPSKVLNKIRDQYAGNVEIDIDIYKDKYWQSFDRFIATEDDDLVN